MSAPPKEMQRPDYIGPSYLDQMVEMLTSFAGRNVLLDRSHYGELVWPQVYGRKPQLNDDDMEILREIEETLDPVRILMYDPNSDAHWQRCVDNKEPLTKVQFVKARSIFSNMADKYGFGRKTLKDFPDAVQPLPASVTTGRPSDMVEAEQNKDKPVSSTAKPTGDIADTLNKSKEQLKLERANVINEVLAKRIIKGKGPVYDDIERGVRHFLNSELGKIFGNNTGTPGLTSDEVELLKFFCQRLKDKENT